MTGQPYGLSFRGIKHIITSWIVRAVAWICRHSSLRTIHRLGDFFGSILLRVVTDRRSMAEDNIRLCLPEPLSDEEVHNILRSSTQNITKTMLELFKVPTISPERLRKLVPVDGMKHVERGVRDGKGVLLVTAHFGNWEYLGCRLALDHPTTGVARDAAHKATARVINSARETFGARIIAREDLRQMLRCLRRNEILFIVADQHVTEGGVMVDFLGRPAMAPRGPAHLGMRTGCAVLPAFCIRGKDDSLRIKILPPIEMVRTEDSEKDVRRNTQRIYDMYADMIQKHPRQWLWLHRRWRNLETDEEKNGTTPA